MNALIAIIISIRFHAGQLEKALILLVRPNESTRLQTISSEQTRKRLTKIVREVVSCTKDATKQE
jgi:hypothetical protein